MCHVIVSRYIVANYLLRHAKASLTIKDLKYLQKQIEQQLPSVFVDISRQSLISTVEEYPQMFTWDINGISRAKGSSSLFDEDCIDHEFNSRLPREVKSCLLECLK